MDIVQLIGIETVHTLDLGDHLVAAAGDVEPVDKVAAHHGGQVSAHLLQIQSHFGCFVTVNDDFGLGLVDFDIDDGRKGEQPAFGCGRLDLSGELQELLGFGR